jgi:hypothetical protein
VRISDSASELSPDLLSSIKQAMEELRSLLWKHYQEQGLS